MGGCGWWARGGWVWGDGGYAVGLVRVVGVGIVGVIGPPHYSQGNYNFPRSTEKINFFDEISSV